GAEPTDRTGTQPGKHLAVDVLQVDMRHTLAVPAKGLDWVAPTHRVVADVEAEWKLVHADRGGGQPLDLTGRLHVRPGVGVERDPGTGRAGLVGDRLEKLDRPRPPGVGEPGRARIVRPAGGRVAVRRAVERDAQDLAAAGDEETEAFSHV